MPQRLSFSITYDDIMPCSHHRASIKSNRCYSWPPSLQLIDVSNIQIPLSDINEDPWAHFMDRSSDRSDDTDDFLVNAGIIPPEPEVMLAQKAVEFRDIVLKRWKAFVSRYLRQYHRCHQQQKMKVILSTPDLSQNIMSTFPFKLADAADSSPEKQPLSSFQPSTTPLMIEIRPHIELTPKQVQLIYGAANGSHKPPRHTPSNRSERRSWVSPAVWLYDIPEQTDEDMETDSND
jgi:hypothetical protein